jgi:type I restriction enzyme M protein
MDGVMYKEVRIEDLFELKGGNGNYTKEYCDKNKGRYPVYSSNNSDVFKYINTYDYNGTYLSWSIVGLAGYITKICGKFSLTNNRGLFLVKKEYENSINLTYVANILEPILRKNKKGRIDINGQNEYTTLNHKNIKNIKERIPIPINPDGSFNLEKQKEIAKKYEILERYRKKMEKKKRELEEVGVEILGEYEGREVRLDKIFKIERGIVISKRYINDNRGEYPVYSSAIKDDGIIGYINNYKYDGEYLTWATDNIFKPMYRNGKFNCTNVCGCLKLKSNLDNINIIYISHILSNSDLGFNWGKKASIDKISSLVIKIPTHPDGSFDLEKQKEIVKKYEKVQEVKKRVIDDLEKLIKQEVVVV